MAAFVLSALVVGCSDDGDDTEQARRESAEQGLCMLLGAHPDGAGSTRAMAEHMVDLLEDGDVDAADANVDFLLSRSPEGLDGPLEDLRDAIVQAAAEGSDTPLDAIEADGTTAAIDAWAGENCSDVATDPPS